MASSLAERVSPCLFYMLTNHKRRSFQAAIFIDFGVIEMKVPQGHFHLLQAYGFSSHVNYFATFHFNSLLSLSGRTIIEFLFVKIFRFLS